MRRIIIIPLLAAFAFCMTASIGASLFAADDKRMDAADGEKEEKAGDDKKASEDALFDEKDTLVQEDKVKDDKISDSIEKPSLNFNGFLNSRTSGFYIRDSILRDIGVLDDRNFLSYFQGDFALDARLIRGIKGYVNVSAEYYPAGIPKSHSVEVPASYLGVPSFYTRVDMMVSEKINALFAINEMFLDVNIAQKIYFRLGKQTLKWGTSYLWTPTDLINVEKKNILDWSQVRQGTYGLKMHIPFGTKVNIYSFANLNDVKKVIDISSANKIEFLLGNTEISLSAFVKNKNVPVYGADFTTRILTLDVHGEAAVSYGDNTRKLRVYPWSMALAMPGELPGQLLQAQFMYRGYSLMDYKIKGEWVPKASFGFGRGFTVKDVKDRVRIDVEGFYNHTGYRRNIFEKDVITTGYFLSRGLYETNYYGKYYAGMFITVRQMFVEELAASVNCIVNVQDQSSVISGMLSYTPFYDLTVNLMVNGFVGKTNREYTVFGNYATAELSLKLVF